MHVVIVHSADVDSVHEPVGAPLSTNSALALVK
jgi:hypothetical protein